MKRPTRKHLWSGAMILCLIAVALIYYSLALRPRKGDPMIYQNAGDAAMAGGNFSRARREYAEALSLYRSYGISGPLYADSLQRMAQLDLAVGQQQEASDILKQAADNSTAFTPAWAWIIVHRTEILNSLQREDEANRYLSDADVRCAASPDCQELERVILSVGQSEYAVAAGNRPEALERLTQVQAAIQKNSAAFSMPAQCPDAVSAASMVMDMENALSDWSAERRAGREDLKLSSCAPQSSHALDILVKTGIAEAACGNAPEAKRLWDSARAEYLKMNDPDGAQRVAYLVSELKKNHARSIACASE